MRFRFFYFRFNHSHEKATETPQPCWKGRVEHVDLPDAGLDSLDKALIVLGILFLIFIICMSVKNTKVSMNDLTNLLVHPLLVMGYIVGILVALTSFLI